jgi:hypothetical protein
MIAVIFLFAFCFFLVLLLASNFKNRSHTIDVDIELQDFTTPPTTPRLSVDQCDDLITPSEGTPDDLSPDPLPTGCCVWFKKVLHWKSISKRVSGPKGTPDDLPGGPPDPLPPLTEAKGEGPEGTRADLPGELPDPLPPLTEAKAEGVSDPLPLTEVINRGESPEHENFLWLGLFIFTLGLYLIKGKDKLLCTSQLA